MTNPETALEQYFKQYPPATSKLGKALRAKLRARLPGFNEVVYLYENQGSLLISYSASENGYEALCSLALYPDRVALHFGQGAQLSRADPCGLLQGRGKTVRHVTLATVAEFERQEVEDLLAAALELSGLRPEAGAQGSVILKADEQKARARRAKKAPRAAPAKKKAPRAAAAKKAPGKTSKKRSTKA